MIKHKFLKIHWSTWRKIRGVIPGKEGETMNDYIQRVVSILEIAEKEVKHGN